MLNTKPRQSFLAALADFGAGVVVPALCLTALVALFVAPLFLLARALGVC